MKSSFELVARSPSSSCPAVPGSCRGSGRDLGQDRLTHIEIFRLRLVAATPPHELSVKLTNLFLYDEEHRKKIDVLVLEMTTLRIAS